MLKHIVFIRVTDSQSKTRLETIKVLRDKLLELSPEIETVLHLEVGENISARTVAYDLALVVHFADEVALETYRFHPSHVKVLDYMKTLDIETAVVDYFYDE